MSYITVDELKEMSDSYLETYWSEAHFPFDLATCENCVTQHIWTNDELCQHKDFQKQVRTLPIIEHDFAPWPVETEKEKVSV